MNYQNNTRQRTKSTSHNPPPSHPPHLLPTISLTPLSTSSTPLTPNNVLAQVPLINTTTGQFCTPNLIIGVVSAIIGISYHFTPASSNSLSPEVASSTM